MKTLSGTLIALIVVAVSPAAGGLSATAAAPDAFEQATVAFINEDFDKAEAIYQSLITAVDSSSDDRARAWRGVGEIRSQEKDFRRASECFLRAVADCPDADPAILGECQRSLARMYMQMQAKEKSVSEIVRAFAYYPDVSREYLARCQTDLGEYHWINNEYLRSEKTLENLLAAYPDAGADVQAETWIMLALALRDEKLKIDWFPFILACSEKPLIEYPSADLNTISHALYNTANFFEMNSMAERSLAAYVKEWIFSTRDSQRSDRTLWVLVRRFSNMRDGDVRRQQFVDFLRYGKPGKDGIAGTADDLKNSLPGFEKLTAEACGARRWPENVLEPGQPEPGPLDTWDDLLEYFERRYQDLPDSARTRAEKIADYIISCSKGADGNTLRAQEFFEREEIAGQGLKKEVTGKTRLNLKRQQRIVRIISELYGAIYKHHLERDLEHEDAREVVENKSLLKMADACMRRGEIEASSAAFKIMIALPLVEVEETTADAARGLLAAAAAAGTDQGGCLPYWKSACAEKILISTEEEARAAVRGIFRALAEAGRDGDLRELRGFLVEKYPDSPVTSAILTDFPPDSPECEKIIEAHPLPRAGGTAAVIVIERLAGEGKDAEAVARAEKYLAAYPASPNKILILGKLALIYEKRNETGKAVAVYREAAETAAETVIKADYWKRAAEIELRRGNADAALGEYRQTIEALLPENPDEAAGAMIETGGHCLELGRYPEAIRLYRRAAALLRPDEFLPGADKIDAVTTEELGIRAAFWRRYLTDPTGPTSVIPPEFSEVITRYPSSLEAAQAHYLIARGQLEGKDLKAAGENVALAGKVFPEDPKIRTLTGKIKKAVADEEKRAAAISFLIAGINRETGEGIAALRYQLGETYLSGEDYSAALAEFRQIVADFPESPFAPRALYQAGLICGKYLHDREKGDEYLGELLCLYPEEEPAFATLKHLFRTNVLETSGFPAVLPVPRTSQIDYTAVENDFSSGNFDRVIAVGAPEYRRLLQAHPELRSRSRKLAVLGEARRETLVWLEALTDDNQPVDRIPSTAATFELLNAMQGEEDSSNDGLTPGEDRFMKLFEQACREHSRETVTRAWTTFSSKPHPAEIKQKAVERVFCYLLLVEKEDAVPDMLGKMISGGISPAGWLRQADLCLAAGKTELAFAVYDRASEDAGPTSGKIAAREQKALAYEKLGRINLAIETHREIVRSFPATKNAVAAQRRIYYIYALRWKVYDTAIRECRYLIENFPATPQAAEAAFRIGDFAFLNKNYPQAHAFLQEFVEKHPRSRFASKARFLLGVSLMQEEKRDEARDVFRRFLRDYPKNEYASRAQYLIGYCHYLDRNYEQAAKEFQKLLELYPQSAYWRESENLLQQIKTGSVKHLPKE